MNKGPGFDPHEAEDAGYLAAEAGKDLSANTYPSGTIRFEEWRRGWHIKTGEIRRAVRLGEGHSQEDEGYLAAAAGQAAADNPYPSKTLRYDDWRRGWRVKKDEMQRASRLHRGPGFEAA